MGPEISFVHRPHAFLILRGNHVGIQRSIIESIAFPALYSVQPRVYVPFGLGICLGCCLAQIQPAASTTQLNEDIVQTRYLLKHSVLCTSLN
jgi:hypothetical protein